MKYLLSVLTIILSLQLNAQNWNLPKNYMPIGINAGAGGSGGVFGGELSFVHTGDDFGYGFFVDVLANKNGSRIFAGPEIFIPSNNSSMIIGLEAGGVTNTRTNKSGFMLGLFIPYYVIPYFRFFNLGGESFAEAGVLFKFPIPITD